VRRKEGRGRRELTHDNQWGTLCSHNPEGAHHLGMYKHGWYFASLIKKL
jgi:hypothetical protein